MVWFETCKKALPTTTSREYSLYSRHGSSLQAPGGHSEMSACGCRWERTLQAIASLSRGLSAAPGRWKGRRALRVGFGAGEGESAASPCAKVVLWGIALSPSTRKGRQIRNLKTAPEKPKGVTSVQNPHVRKVLP